MKSIEVEKKFLAVFNILYELGMTFDSTNFGYCRCHTSDADEEYKVGEVFKVARNSGGGKDFSDSYRVFGECPPRFITFDYPEEFHELFEEISKEQYDKILIEKRFDL